MAAVPLAAVPVASCCAFVVSSAENGPMTAAAACVRGYGRGGGGGRGGVGRGRGRGRGGGGGGSKPCLATRRAHGLPALGAVIPGRGRIRIAADQGRLLQHLASSRVGCPSSLPPRCSSAWPSSRSGSHAQSKGLHSNVFGQRGRQAAADNQRSSLCSGSSSSCSCRSRSRSRSSSSSSSSSKSNNFSTVNPGAEAHACHVVGDEAVSAAHLSSLFSMVILQPQPWEAWRPLLCQLQQQQQHQQQQQQQKSQNRRTSVPLTQLLGPPLAAVAAALQLLLSAPCLSADLPAAVMDFIPAAAGAATAAAVESAAAVSNAVAAPSTAPDVQTGFLAPVPLAAAGASTAAAATSAAPTGATAAVVPPPPATAAAPAAVAAPTTTSAATAAAAATGGKTEDVGQWQAVVVEAWEVIRDVFVDARGRAGWTAEAWEAKRQMLEQRPAKSQREAHAMIGSMLAGLNDPYTRFISPSKFSTLSKYDITGVGLNIGDDVTSAGDRVLRVVGIVLESPAQSAGIRQGDEVLAVDGRSVKGLSSFEVASLIQGQKGTPVTITVRQFPQQQQSEMTSAAAGAGEGATPAAVSAATAATAAADTAAGSGRQAASMGLTDAKDRGIVRTYTVTRGSDVATPVQYRVERRRTAFRTAQAPASAPVQDSSSSSNNSSSPGSLISASTSSGGTSAPATGLAAAAGASSPAPADTDGVEVTGYIKVREFNAVAKRDLAEAVRRLDAAGAKLLVLDLQGNPGGLVQAGVESAKLFLDPGDTVVFTRGRDLPGGRTSERSVEATSPALSRTPLVVLVDARTASASEIVAGALRDNCRAVLVGTSNTFGKGLIQSVYELQDGSGLVVTVGKYVTPAHRDIDLDGIKPDFKRPPGEDVVRHRLATCKSSGGVLVGAGVS